MVLIMIFLQELYVVISKNLCIIVTSEVQFLNLLPLVLDIENFIHGDVVEAFKGFGALVFLPDNLGLSRLLLHRLLFGKHLCWFHEHFDFIVFLDGLGPLPKEFADAITIKFVGPWHKIILAATLMIYYFKRTNQ